MYIERRLTPLIRKEVMLNGSSHDLMVADSGDHNVVDSVID